MGRMRRREASASWSPTLGPGDPPSPGTPQTPPYFPWFSWLPGSPDLVGPDCWWLGTWVSEQMPDTCHRLPSAFPTCSKNKPSNGSC